MEDMKSKRNLLHDPCVAASTGLVQEPNSSCSLNTPFISAIPAKSPLNFYYACRLVAQINLRE